MKSTRDGTHTRSRRQASGSGGERCVPRAAPTQREDLRALTSHFNPFGGSPSGDDLMQSAASKPANKRRGLKESCKTMSPSSPDTTPSNLVPRAQWMKEDDPRTEEQADADWRLVTESIFGANTGAAPKVVEEKDWCDERFKPNWGGHVTQESRDEDKRDADEWRARNLADARRAVAETSSCAPQI